MAVPFLDLKALHRPLDREIRAALERVMEHGRFIKGPEVGDFEEAWANYCGVPASAGAANGTAALHAILATLGVGPGDEVIAPSHTFIATVESILLTGARPVLVEVDRETWLMDPEAVRAAIGPRTAAIVPVHIYGSPAPMEEINGVACAHGLPVVEDASQAHGADYRGRRAGALGLAAAFSFFPGKNLGAFGDAGGMTSLDADLGRRLRLYVDHGREDKYRHDFIGTNYRLDTLQAAILLAKLPHLDRWIARRREIACRYAGLLAEEPFASAPVRIQRLPEGAASSYHLFVIKVPNRDRVREVLAEKGIGTGIHYPIPCHLQPALAAIPRGTARLEATEELAGSILSLPMCPTLDDTQIEQVVDALAAAIKTGKRKRG